MRPARPPPQLTAAHACRTGHTPVAAAWDAGRACLAATHEPATAHAQARCPRAALAVLEHKLPGADEYSLGPAPLRTGSQLRRILTKSKVNKTPKPFKTLRRTALPFTPSQAGGALD
eukprot:7377682-Prymnesium_polylepis.1